MHQIDLFKKTETINNECNIHSGFHTTACVPGGLFCDNCNAVVIRDMPPAKNEPKELGYTSANWAWKYKHGKEWTTDC